MFNRLEFVFSEAFKALTRNRLMTFAAITTVAMSLFLLGGLGYAYFSLSKFAQTIPGKFQMLVYLKDDATRQDVSRAAAEFRTIPGVSSATWVPKDKAWERWKVEHPVGITKGIDNPLPEGFKIILSDLKKSDSVVASIKAMPVVDEVRYMREEQNFVEGLLTALKVVGGVCGGVLLLIAGLLIYNAIRLTVLSRRVEIRIMQLVGASRPTVYVPFLIEGMLQGVVGAAAATGLVIGAYFGYGFAIHKFVNFSYSLPEFPYVPVVLILSGAGALYGILCSTFAIRAPLKYR